MTRKYTCTSEEFDAAQDREAARLDKEAATSTTLEDREREARERDRRSRYGPIGTPSRDRADKFLGPL